LALELGGGKGLPLKSLLGGGKVLPLDLGPERVPLLPGEKSSTQISQVLTGRLN
jgi:hypothetical protein